MTSLKSITDKFDAWRRYREAVRELSSLSDRELADIGLCRGDITFAVREVAHGVAPDIDSVGAPLTAAHQNLRRAA